MTARCTACAPALVPAVPTIDLARWQGAPASERAAVEASQRAAIVEAVGAAVDTPVESSPRAAVRQAVEPADVCA